MAGILRSSILGTPLFNTLALVHVCPAARLTSDRKIRILEMAAMIHHRPHLVRLIVRRISLPERPATDAQSVA
jgi:hypothetical protein